MSLGLVLAAMPVHSQMILGSVGRLHDIDRESTTYTWKIDYRQQVAPGWGVSLGWLNEGHIPDHHRDGAVLEGWKYWQLGDRPGHIAVGTGIYRAYDTITSGQSYRNEHGYRALFTLGFWRPLDSEQKWLGTFEVNRTSGGWDPQTQSVSIGIARRLGKAFGTEPEPSGPAAPILQQTLNLYYGTTILNSFSSETSDGYQIEYRRNISRFWEWSLAYSHEGSSEVMSREGLVAQVWIGRWFLDQKLQPSFGWGPYVNQTRTSRDGGTTWESFNKVSLRSTLGLAYRVSGNVAVRLAWNRTMTSSADSLDTDLIVGGLGFGW